MKRDEGEKCSKNSIGLLRCTEITREVFCGYGERRGHRGLRYGYKMVTSYGVAEVADAHASDIDDADTSGRSGEDEALEMLGRVGPWRWLQNGTGSGAVIPRSR
jgi:hypothetical protein